MNLLAQDTSLQHLVKTIAKDFRGEIATDVPLKQLSRWRIGGTAQCIMRPSCHADIECFVHYMQRFNMDYAVIGATSNLLFADEGVFVPLLQIDQNYSHLTIEAGSITCQSGAWVPGFSRALAQQGLAGLEHIVGIPGTLGGLVCMNGGSQRKGVGEFITRVKTVTTSGETRVYNNEDCQFAYRHSIFLELDDIISEIQFLLPSANKQQIHSEMLAILRSRSKKFPRKQPNCGSVFVSNPAMYAEYGSPGEVIERCGLKGLCRGGARISPLHANFIVNENNASARDVLGIIHQVRNTVKNTTGYAMKAEALFVHPNGAMAPAHIVASELFDATE